MTEDIAWLCYEAWKGRVGKAEILAFVARQEARMLLLPGELRILDALAFVRSVEATIEALP